VVLYGIGVSTDQYGSSRPRGIGVVYGQRRHPERVSVLPVVGGTGAYANARGTMSFAEIGETGRARLTFSVVP
jgi:hypothetical protein